MSRKLSSPNACLSHSIKEDDYCHLERDHPGAHAFPPPHYYKRSPYYLKVRGLEEVVQTPDPADED